MLGIDPETFEFERENRTHCAIKIEKNMFSLISIEKADNRVVSLSRIGWLNFSDQL